MADCPTWFEWLSGLISGLWSSDPPAPGTKEALLEEQRAGALLDKELRKPQPDIEAVRSLQLGYRTRQLRNLQAKVDKHARTAARFERPITCECCAAARWVWPRLAASYQAQHDYYTQWSKQVKEELAAAEARRQPLIVAQPALHLDLPAALQQPPPRLDMCRVRANRLEQVELVEQSLRVHEDWFRKHHSSRGLQPAPAAAAASQGAAGGAGAAGGVPAEEAQHAKQQQGRQQDKQQQQGQQQQQSRQQQGQQQQQGRSIVVATALVIA